MGLAIHARAQETDARAIKNYIMWFHSNVKQSQLERAVEYLPGLFEYSHKYQVDPLVIACLISFETSWRPREGKAGEQGIIQVMPGKWTRENCDMTTTDGQFECGVKRWRLAKNSCEGLEGALTHYACGKCQSKSETTKDKVRYRVKYIKAVIKKFRNFEVVEWLDNIATKGRTI